MLKRVDRDFVAQYLNMSEYCWQFGVRHCLANNNDIEREIERSCDFELETSSYCRNIWLFIVIQACVFQNAGHNDRAAFELSYIYELFGCPMELRNAVYFERNSRVLPDYSNIFCEIETSLELVYQLVIKSDDALPH